MSYDLRNKNISDTFQNLLQRTGSDNRLYDLEGNEIKDLRISGSLIADQYIVSSSVTNQIVLASSGSTQFGDTSGDTHKFTGSAYFKNSIYLNNGIIHEDPVDATPNISIGNAPFSLNLNSLDENSTGWTGMVLTQSRVGIGTDDPGATLHVIGDISSSGDSSGNSRISAKNATFGTGTVTIDGVEGDISASGEISASGTITGNALQVQGNAAVSMTGDKLQFGQYIGDVTIGKNTTQTTFSVLAHITASGNISASGDILANGNITATGGELQSVGSAPKFQLTETDTDVKDQLGSDHNPKFVMQSLAGNFMVANEISNQLAFKIRHYAPTDSLTISGSGFNTPYVGIGAGASPPKTLTVGGDISASGNIYLSHGGSQNIYFSNTSTEVAAGFQYSATKDRLIWYGWDGAGSGNSARFHISTSGGYDAEHTRFGIGVNTNDDIPSTLTVEGDISASGNFYLPTGGIMAFATSSAGAAKNKIAESGDDLYIDADDHMFIQANDNTMNIIAGTNILFYTGSTSNEFMRIDRNSIPGGALGIGNTNPTKKLTVAGDISASGTVYASQFNDDGTNLNVPDYVFEPKYKLRTLTQVEQHISQSKHLPGIPSIEDKNGWNQLSVGDRDMKLLEKVEELTLYIINLQKQINELKQNK